MYGKKIEVGDKIIYGMPKVGEKLLCKKNSHRSLHSDGFNTQSKFGLIKGIHYEVLEVISFSVLIKGGLYPHSSAYETMYFQTNFKSKGSYFLWDHFYTAQELRKLKLKELCTK